MKYGSDLRWVMPRLLVNSDTRRSYLFEGNAGLVFVRGSACVNWGTLYFVAGLAYVSPVHPEDRSISGHVRPTIFLGSACVVSPLLFARRAPGGPIYFKASPIYYFLGSTGVMWGPLYFFDMSKSVYYLQGHSATKPPKYLATMLSRGPAAEGETP